MKKIGVLLFLLLPLLGFSQERIFKFLLVYQGPEVSRYRPALESALLKSTPNLQLVRAEDDSDKKAQAFYAQRWSCDGILTVQSQVTDRKIQVDWMLSPVQDGPVLVAGSFSREPGSWSNQAEIFWISLTTRLDEFLTLKGDQVPRAVEASVSRVLLRAVPGTIITGLPGSPVPVGQDGLLEVELTYPASYTFQGSHTAYRTEATHLFLLTDRVEITLEQNPEKVWSWEVGLMGGSFPYGQVSWSLIPGRLFFRGGVHQYLFGLSLNSFRVEDEATKSMVASLPLFHLNAGVGGFLNSPENLVRYYLCLDLFGRFMTPGTLILEPVATWGLRPLFGLEYRPVEVFSLYFETGPQAFMLNNSEAFLASRPKDGIPILVMANNLLGVEPLVFQVGARFFF